MPKSSRQKWTERARVACSICGEPTGYGITQVGQASHKACKRTQWEHGTGKGYRTAKCRCEACRQWNAEYNAQLRAARLSDPTSYPPCSQPDCTRPATSRKMCAMHYKRWARANGMVKPSPSDRWTEKRQAQYHERRARMNGAPNGDGTILTQIIGRSGTDCAGCGITVDLSLTYPHPMSKSIDHVRPLSRGGAHTLENTQLMHLRCNLSKGARFTSSGRSFVA